MSSPEFPPEDILTALSFRRAVPTFLGAPAADIASVRSGDVAVFAASHATPYPSTDDVDYDLETGSADAPAAIRRAAVQSSSNLDHWDFDLDGPLFGDSPSRLVDCGDLETAPADGPGNRAQIEAATRALVARGALPVLLGGDDSVPIPFHRGFADVGPLAILQIDAHIDWRDRIGGEPDGYSSTMRRASELPFVRSIVQVGARGIGSARREEVEAARAWGARIVTAEAFRDAGSDAVLAALPAGLPVLIALDLDAYDPSLVPAVNAPTPGGLFFHEIAGLVRRVAAARPVAGLSVVELAPRLDASGVSAIVAARFVLNAVGAIVRRPTSVR
jgi:agmatinase